MSVANLESGFGVNAPADTEQRADVIPIRRGNSKEHVLFVRGTLEPRWWLQRARRNVQDAGYEVDAARSRFPLNFVWGEMEAVEKHAEKLADMQERPIKGVGHSLGGLILEQLQEQRPDLIEHTVGMGSPLSKRLNNPLFTINKPSSGLVTSIYIGTDHIVPFVFSKNSDFTGRRVSEVEWNGIVPIWHNHLTLPYSRNVQQAVREALATPVNL